MAGGVAQAQNAGHFAEAAQQRDQRCRRAVLAGAVIGVDVLPDQRDFAHARRGKTFDLGRDFSTGREISTPRV